MAKVKSIKCYNFTDFPDRKAYMSFNMIFYDSIGNLIPLDFSNPISSVTTTYCETSECIVTASSSYNNGCYGPHMAFHTGNVNKYCGLNYMGYCWDTASDRVTSYDWIKIEFKFPQIFSDIKILHSVSNATGFNTCNYDIEYEDSIIETNLYVSDGIVSPFTHGSRITDYDQDLVDDQFISIEFNGKTITVYDTKVGYVETLDNNNFRNIPVDTFEKLKILYAKHLNTTLNCVVSFDKKQTWKTFDGANWSTISDTSPENIVMNCMEIETLNHLNKSKLISGGFTGDLDFKIAMKTNDVYKTPSVTKIYIEYK